MELSHDVQEVEMEESGEFARSFDLADDNESICAFFDRYGFVVFRNILTTEECNETLREFWDEAGDDVKADVPDTWTAFWNSQRFGKMGIIGLMSNIASKSQLDNRQNPRVYEAFKKIHRDDKLIVDHDRLGVMRPTVRVPFKSGPQDRPEWRTIQNWLHLDCHPIEGYASIGSFACSGSQIDFLKTLIVQGFLALTDARVENGGFHCVPGSHKFCSDWVEKADKKSMVASHTNVRVFESSPLHERIRRVPVRRGSLVIWTSLLFHGNHPNVSGQFRAVQYIRQLPSSGTPYMPLIRQPEHLQADGFTPSELGQKLFGFKSW
ncbi:hypothetical protein DIPPA_58863 [Diplonema papillatum]|nr:hypothetical protein DIPPA_58863 [Diplonema papillatum]